MLTCLSISSPFHCLEASFYLCPFPFLPMFFPQLNENKELYVPRGSSGCTAAYLKACPQTPWPRYILPGKWEGNSDRGMYFLSYISIISNKKGSVLLTVLHSKSSYWKEILSCIRISSLCFFWFLLEFDSSSQTVTSVHLKTSPE